MIGVYLLWKIGTTHDDFNLLNLMPSCDQNSKISRVLNDFDLAVTMEPCGCHPIKKSWERTGTLPFMPLELLKYFEGQVKRWYRHDLESSNWCLVVCMLEKGHTAWLARGHDAYMHKCAFTSCSSLYDVKPAWRNFLDFNYDWLEQWSGLDLLRAKAIRKVSCEERYAKLEEEDMKVQDEVYIKGAIDEASKHQSSGGTEVLESSDEWINVLFQRGI